MKIETKNFKIHTHLGILIIFETNFLIILSKATSNKESLAILLSVLSVLSVRPLFLDL